MTLKLQSIKQALLHKKLLVSSVLAIGIVLTALPFTSKAVDENDTLSPAEQSLKTTIDTILADDTFFDTKQLGNNWTWDNAAFSWQPEISALTVAATPNFDIGTLRSRLRLNTSRMP